MRNTLFTFLVLFLSGCSVLKTEQARTDDASSRSTSRFLNKLRSFHGKSLVISCYKGPHLLKLKEIDNKNRIRLPGWGSIFNLLGRIADKRVALREVRMIMGPTGNLTGTRFRRYSGMIDKMVYLKDIDENAAFYTYRVPHPTLKNRVQMRVGILKIVNSGISIIKVDPDDPFFNNKTNDYRYYHYIPFNDYMRTTEPDGKLTEFSSIMVTNLLRYSESHLLSRMNKLDPNTKPDWVLLLKANYYQAMFNDNDMPAFYSNF